MASIPEADLTVVYYTANVIPFSFGYHVLSQLAEAIGDLPIIVVSKKPMLTDWENIVVDTPRSHLNIYRDALTGVKAAKTKYVALCEDDVLYSPEHFTHRSSSGKFAYNLGAWYIHTWGDPLFTHKGTNRKNLHGLICERDLFIEAMEERFAKIKPGQQIDTSTWAEPGKYERHLAVTQRETEEFYTNPPNVVFVHQTALAYSNLGKKKRLGEFRANEIPYWGKAEQIFNYYKNEEIRPIHTNTR